MEGLLVDQREGLMVKVGKRTSTCFCVEYQGARATAQTGMRLVHLASLAASQPVWLLHCKVLLRLLVRSAMVKVKNVLELVPLIDAKKAHGERRKRICFRIVHGAFRVLSIDVHAL